MQPCVVARGDVIRFQTSHGVVEKQIKFDVPVSQNVGVGGDARVVPVERGCKHFVPIFFDEIHLVARHLQGPADLLDIGVIFFKTVRGGRK